MKKIIPLLLIVCFYNFSFVHAQRKCGIDELKASLTLKYPEIGAKIEAKRASSIVVAENFEKNIKSKNSNKTSSGTTITIPVVFHIVVNESQYEEMGGRAGIEQRCLSQIEVLNNDFNAQNADSVLIPSLWKSKFANVGIHFGLTHTTPNGYPTAGYTIRIISGDGFSDRDSAYHLAKITSLGGSDAWDVTKYINVWCINFTDFGGILGITTPISFTGTAPNSVLTLNDEGICILYNILGKRSNPSDSYPYHNDDGYKNYFDLGRTLTHEMGHFFEIWHVWGDDDTACPWTGGRRVLPDLPPQGGKTITNPKYTIPGGTINDNCKDSAGTNTQPIGIACLDYMDYTDDSGMHLFTNDQAAVMLSQIANDSSENYSLTLHPELLNFPTGAPQVLNAFPNPTNGIISLYYEDKTNPILTIVVFDCIGSEICKISPTVKDDFINIDLSSLPVGTYIIKCIFNASVITQKITLQSVAH